MLLERLDTNRVCYAKELPTRDHFEAGQVVVPGLSALEIEWDEAHRVVYLRKVAAHGAPELKPRLLAIVPLEAVQNMWPLDT